MKIPSTIALALSAFAVVGASAQTYYSGQADQERRERNREEALSAYRTGHSPTTTTSTSMHGDHETMRERGHDAASSARRGTHKVAESTRRVTHKSANAVRRVGHKTAEKARDITDRVNVKFGAPVGQGKANPEGINPVGVNSGSPTAPSHGTTK